MSVAMSHADIWNKIKVANTPDWREWRTLLRINGEQKQTDIEMLGLLARVKPGTPRSAFYVAVQEGVDGIETDADLATAENLAGPNWYLDTLYDDLEVNRETLQPYAVNAVTIDAAQKTVLLDLTPHPSFADAFLLLPKATNSQPTPATQPQAQAGKKPSAEPPGRAVRNIRI